MIAPLARSCATIVESNGGTSIAKLTSLFDVVRMSFVSKGSLNGRDDAVHRQRGRSGLRPYFASSSAARSSASGCWRNFSHAAGAPAGSGPVDGCASNSPLQVTERSPRMFSVSSALTCPASGMPTRMPICCHHARVGDRLLHAPVFERQALVSVEIREDRRGLHGLRGEHQRLAGAHIALNGLLDVAPSAVTSAVQTPL